MTEYKDFSSLPPETEREFVVYEKTSVEAGKKAKFIALGVAVSFLVIVMAIVFSFPKPHNLMAEDDMGGLAAPKDGKAEKKPADKPKTEGAAAGEAKPAEGAAAGEAKPAEGAAAGEAKPAEGAAAGEAKPAAGEQK
jgi:hypothetical protein